MSTNLLKKSVTNSFFTTLGTGANFIITILFAGYRIKLLGLERAGYLMLLESFVMISTTFGGFGLGTAAIKRMSEFFGKKDNKNAARTLSSVLFFNCVIGLIFAAIIFLMFEYIFNWSKTNLMFKYDAYVATLLMSIIFIIKQLTSTYEITFSSFQRFDIKAFVTTLFGLLNGAFGLLVLYYYPTMTALTSLVLVLAIIHLFTSYFYNYKIIKLNILPRFNFDEIKKMAKFGGWTYLTSLSKLLANGLDRLLLTTFLGSASLPFYVIGQKVIMMIHTFLLGQSSFIFPMLSAEERLNKRIESIEDKLRWFLAIISIFIYSTLAIISKSLLTFLVDYEFMKFAYIPFLIACLQGLLLAQAIVPYFLSWAEGKGAPNALFEFFSGILIFISAILLIPKFDVIGLSVAQLWKGVLVAILIYWIMKSSNRFTLFKYLRPLITPFSTLFLIIIISLFVPFNFNYVSNLILLVFILIILFSLNIYLEKKIFNDYKCINILFNAIKIFLEKIRIKIA